MPRTPADSSTRPRSASALGALAAMIALTTLVAVLAQRPALASDTAASPRRIDVAVPIAPAVRLAPVIQVTAAPQPPAAPPVNRSNCRTDLAGAAMTITIVDISYSCPVYFGDQRTLDSGAVTAITDPALTSVLATQPGGEGTLWIAGHRTSHGGAFAAVPNLADGALITVSNGGVTATYRVVSRVYVHIVNDQVVDSAGRPSGAATVDAILRTDRGGGRAPRLLLQTCDGANQRWMIYADLVS